LGPAEIYTEGAPSAQRSSIVCYTHEDAGILHKAVSLPLTHDARLRWAWKVNVLPCQNREDLLQNRDYLSIAVELDNGQDLTYFWSAELEPETGFRCPIPAWTARDACRRLLWPTRARTLAAGRTLSLHGLPNDSLERQGNATK
jgi:hypothetical protein